MKKLRNATFFQFKTNQHFVFRYSLIFFSKLRQIKIIFFNVQNILNKMKYNMTKKTLCDFFFLDFETTHHLGLPTGQTQIGIVGIPTWLVIPCFQSARFYTNYFFQTPCI